MFMEGLLLFCAGTLFLADPPVASPAGDDRDRQIASTLAVQTALEQGRELILRGDFRTAVHVLEGQITHINGNRAYLRALQDAYRGHIKELRLAKDDAAAETYVRRLRILDPGSLLEQAGETAAKTSRAPTPTPAAPAVAKAEPVRQPAIRMQGGEEPTPVRKQEPAARTLLAQADQEFARQRYAEAARLYEQAQQLDRELAGSGRARLAYCKLHAVAEQLNQSGNAARLVELERDVQRALELAPQLDFGQQLLAEIGKRRSAPTPMPDRWQNLPVQHAHRNQYGWCLAESANFRVFHNQPQELAARVAREAERTRTEMMAKWFGSVERPWNSKCDIYLHATAQDYHKLTGLPTDSPGHSKLAMEGTRLVAPQVHLRCDHSNMVTAILPHETTHVVLAAGFSDVAVPRWADEGIAVLTEPREQIDRHLRNLTKHYQEGTLFPVRELVEQTYQPQQEKYPEARRIGAFYAQSISLVEFLTNLKGPQTLTAFLRDGVRQGYEPALQRYYGMRDFQELQQRWTRHAFSSVAVNSGASLP